MTEAERLTQTPKSRAINACLDSAELHGKDRKLGQKALHCYVRYGIDGLPPWHREWVDFFGPEVLQWLDANAS